MIREYVAAIRIDDDARSGTGDLPRAARHVRKTEETTKSVVAKRMAAAHGLTDADVHHRRRCRFYQRRQANDGPSADTVW